MRKNEIYREDNKNSAFINRENFKNIHISNAKDDDKIIKI
ncbi:hypothetical protein GFV14_00626 [Candidatus Hartigia pinicola]|nr:hypothetical protein GFV14_00626 [Candidatus Hartigia pinicola]